MHYRDVKRAEVLWALMSKQFDFEGADLREITEVEQSPPVYEIVLTGSTANDLVDVEVEFSLHGVHNWFSLKVTEIDVMGQTAGGMTVSGLILWNQDDCPSLQIHERLKIVREYDLPEKQP